MRCHGCEQFKLSFLVRAKEMAPSPSFTCLECVRSRLTETPTLGCSNHINNQTFIGLSTGRSDRIVNRVDETDLNISALHYKKTWTAFDCNNQSEFTLKILHRTFEKSKITLLNLQLISIRDKTSFII